MKLIAIFNKFMFYLLVLFIINTTKSYTQEKKYLKPEDYKQWSTLYNSIISENKDWVSYCIMHNELKKDTLYLKNTSTNKLYTYPSATMGSFSSDNKWFACIKSDTLNMIDLKTGHVQTINDISGYVFTNNAHYILYYTGDVKERTIWIKNLYTFETIVIKKVNDYKFNSDNTILAYIVKENGFNKVKTIYLKSKLITKILLSSIRFDYIGLTWNTLGTSLSFFETISQENSQPVINRIYVYRNMKFIPSIKILDPLKCSYFPKDGYLGLSQIYISDDSKQLFFDLYKKKEVEDNSVVKEKVDLQIWHSDDKQIPPKKYNRPISNIEWSVWWIDNNKIVSVKDKKYPNVILTGDQKNALIYNTEDYLPQYKYVGDYIDLYIKDLFTGKIKLVIKKQLNEFSHTLVSPTGKYITYFKDREWWIYNINNGTHTCITAGLNTSFEDLNYDWAGPKPPYGNPGWMDNDRQLILYDQFDIWLMKPDGSRSIRITDGRKKNTTYRIFDLGYKTYVKTSFFGFVADNFNSNQGILLTSLNNTNLNQGLLYWDKVLGLNKFLEDNKNLYPISKVNNKGSFLFTESDFDLPPRLMLRKISGVKELIVQSNPQQKEFYWGKSELIDYKTSDGTLLKGSLLYPANYIPGKKYPMIVNIYEKLSHQLHKYEPPSEYLFNGFNSTNFSCDGYFVLLPDIKYKLNEPGISATSCVVAAVNQVLEKGFIDKDRIGLIGHSFGGFETTFIISQTNLFKTAIAGASPTDLLDFYLSFDGYDKPHMWRFETQQFRIQSPFFGKDSDFQTNSPIQHVQNINIPLLLWTGKLDPQVSWTQSRKLHTALWRLNKKSTLLVYNDEGHIFMKDYNQKNLTSRIKNWFDYYLKLDYPTNLMNE